MSSRERTEGGHVTAWGFTRYVAYLAILMACQVKFTGLGYLTAEATYVQKS